MRFSTFSRQVAEDALGDLQHGDEGARLSLVLREDLVEPLHELAPRWPVSPHAQVAASQRTAPSLLLVHALLPSVPAYSDTWRAARPSAIRSSHAPRHGDLAPAAHGQRCGRCPPCSRATPCRRRAAGSAAPRPGWCTPRRPASRRGRPAGSCPRGKAACVARTASPPRRGPLQAEAAPGLLGAELQQAQAQPRLLPFLRGEEGVHGGLRGTREARGRCPPRRCTAGRCSGSSSTATAMTVGAGPDRVLDEVQDVQARSHAIAHPLPSTPAAAPWRARRSPAPPPPARVKPAAHVLQEVAVGGADERQARGRRTPRPVRASAPAAEISSASKGTSGGMNPSWPGTLKLRGPRARPPRARRGGG